MKKLISTLFLFAGLYLNSQTIQFNDIVYGKTHLIFETQEYLLKKGLKYMGTEPSWLPDCTIHGFAADALRYQILFSENKKKIIQIEVYMANSKNYLSIKDKIKELGYKLEEPDLNHPLMSQYKKGESSVTFSSGKDEKLGLYYSVTYW